jgi:hypothetical protein
MSGWVILRRRLATCGSQAPFRATRGRFTERMDNPIASSETLNIVFDRIDSLLDQHR